jgi:site-specific DNA recombinase
VTTRAQATPPATKPTRCAVYTRKSTDEGLDSGFSSLDAQREAAEAFIASQKHEGWTCLPDRYDDGGFSGGNMDRPDLRRLLTEVEAGRVDAVVVYKVDRLSRSLLDFSRIIGILDQHGVSFVSVTQQFNTTSSMGRLTLNILLSFAQFERETIAERTRDKMSACRRKGRWTGGIPILGYDVDPQGGRILVNEAEAATVRKVFDLYLERKSLLDTVRDLNRRGITTKRWTTRQGVERGGGPWNKPKLAYMLGNFTFVGKVRYRGEVYPGEHPAIVTDAVWERVQRLLRGNGRGGGRATRNKHGALLRGLLWCTACDAAMVHTYTQKGDRRYRYYVCSHARKQGYDTCPTKSLPAQEIERFVVERIRGIGRDPDLAAEVLKKLRAEATGRSESLTVERKAAERDLRRWTAEVTRVVGTMPHPIGKQSAATARLVELQGLIAGAETKLVEIRQSVAAIDSDVVSRDELIAVLRSFDPVWESLSPPEQARIIHLLVERVAYDGAKETVAVTFRPSGIRTLAGEAA